MAGVLVGHPLVSRQEPFGQGEVAGCPGFLGAEPLADQFQPLILLVEHWLVAGPMNPFYRQEAARSPEVQNHWEEVESLALWEGQEEGQMFLALAVALFPVREPATYPG